MRIRPTLFCLLSLVLGAWVSAADPTGAGFVQVSGRDFIDARGTVLRLRGMNLGNWLLPEGYMWHFREVGSPRQIENVVAELVGDVAAAEFWREWRDTYVTRDDLRLLRAAGLNSVRIPLNWRLFVSEHAPFRMEGPGWALLDRVVGWCREEQLYAVIDLHGAPGGQTGANIDDSRGWPMLFEDPAAEQLTIELWQALAARFAREPWVLGYDLLNEPIADYHERARLNPRLAAFYRRLVPAIRAVDPHHVLLLGGAQWNTQFEVLGSPFGPNLAYTCHFYWDEPKLAGIARYVAWRDQHNVPMWLGESGENTDEWVRELRVLLEQQNIGWCFWPYKKMDAPSCIASYPRPTDWDAIVRYADQARRDDFEAIRRARPPLEVGRRALAELLQNIRLERCRLNAGYGKALGLTLPDRAR